MTDRSRLEVWGDPIAHSRSPHLHRAAYSVLGVDWTYDRRRVSASDFSAEFAGLDDRFRGLSVTYPLKEAAYAACSTRDERAELTGAVNTLLLGPDGAAGFNTDVGGVVGALRECGVEDAESVRIIGAGATATSALIALSELGIRTVEVTARRPEAAEDLAGLSGRLGLVVTTAPWDPSAFAGVDLTISALPGGAAVAPAVAASLAGHGGALFDVVYAQGPTVLSTEWTQTGNPVHTGESMLLHQAVLQVRIFLTGDPATPLPGEPSVVDAMRASLMGD